MNAPQYESQRRELIPFVPHQARTALDVGCSSGAFGEALRADRPGVRVWGVEMNPASAARAAERGYEDVAVGEFPAAVDLLRQRTFDVVFFNDVLEHMADPEPALVTARELVTDAGTVIASIPNVRHFSVVWPLVRRGEWAYEDSGIMDRTHLRFFTASSIRTMFEETGWHVSRMTGINRARWPLGGVDTRKTRMLSRLTGGRSDPFFFAQYVVEARRA